MIFAKGQKVLFWKKKDSLEHPEEENKTIWQVIVKEELVKQLGFVAKGLSFRQPLVEKENTLSTSFDCEHKAHNKISWSNIGTGSDLKTSVWVKCPICVVNTSKSEQSVSQYDSTSSRETKRVLSDSEKIIEFISREIDCFKQRLTDKLTGILNSQQAERVDEKQETDTNTDTDTDKKTDVEADDKENDSAGAGENDSAIRKISKMPNVIQHNHQSNILTFLKDEKMTDVTITVEGKIIKAHKLILAMASKYFEELFTVLEKSHPVIVLKDVSEKYLLLILEYVYSGCVDLLPDEVKEFKRVADSLQIKVEFTVSDDDSDTEPEAKAVTELMSLDLEIEAEVFSIKNEEMVSMQPSFEGDMEEANICLDSPFRSLSPDTKIEPPNKKIKVKNDSQLKRTTTSKKISDKNGTSKWINHKMEPPQERSS